MRVGIRNRALGLEPREALATAAALGYDGVEAGVREPETLERWQTDDGAAEVAGWRRESGCTVSSLSMDCRANLVSPDAAARLAGVTLIERALGACRRIGGNALLVSHFERQRLQLSEPEEQTLVESLRRCASAAAETQVMVALETTFPAAQLRRIVDGAGSPWIGVYHDLANTFIFGYDPAQMLRELGAAVRMIHVKDSGDGARAVSRLGTGRLDWIACRAALRATGYDGWLVVENPMDDDPIGTATHNLAFIRRWLSA